MTLKLNKFTEFFVFLILYLIARIITYQLEIYPIGSELPLKWQLLNPELLKDDLFGSLYYLHFQPPIWNLIYGIMIKIFGIDYNSISIALHFFNIFLSLIMIYFFCLICFHFKLKKKEIYILYFFFFIFSLSFLFYETYIHYTHLTALLFAQISYFILKFNENYSLRFEILIYCSALFLAFTWSAFGHPLFIFTIFIGVCLIKFKKNFLRSFIIFLIFSALIIIPSIKNKIEYNMFANTSWIGMQIYTVLSFGDNWDHWSECNFSPTSNNNTETFETLLKDEVSYKKNNPNFNNNHPSVTGKYSRNNNVGFIHRSKKCMKLGFKQIIDDPLRYIGRVKYLIISNHGHFSFDHLGWDPKEWKKYFNKFYDINNNKFLNPIKVRSLQLYYLSMYLFFIIILFKSIYFVNSDKYKDFKPIAAIFLIYIWLMAVTHLAAGYEHERFRYTGYFLHIIFFILIIKNKFNFKKF